MASRRFVAGFTAPALALLAALTLLAWLLPRPGYYADKALVALLAAGFVALLWQRTRRTNRAIARYLDALEHGDLAQSFRTSGQGAEMDELGAALDRALSRLRAERLASASENRFASALLDEVPTPLLAIDEGGIVHTANKAARRLFREADGRGIAEMARYGTAFAATLETVAPGRRAVCRVLWNGLSQRALLASAVVDRRGRPWRIVALHIIQGELEAAELATQTDLVRVLTHEIMNSLTPVTSLAASAARMMRQARDGDAETLADAALAVDTLARRAAGITHFVDTYRDFGHAPAIEIERFAARPWIDELARSFAATPQAAGVAFDVALADEAMRIDGDAELLGQVVLNLLKNAGEAAAGAADMPRVRIALAAADGGRTRIAVADNGPGVPQALADEIFLPFFTTKPEGTGIGLSFARQIVLLHGGAIGVGRGEGAGAEFVILL